MDTVQKLLQLAVDLGLSPLNIILLAAVLVLWRRLVQVEDRTSENAEKLIAQSRLSGIEKLNSR